MDDSWANEDEERGRDRKGRDNTGLDARGQKKRRRDTETKCETTCVRVCRGGRWTQVSCAFTCGRAYMGVGGCLGLHVHTHVQYVCVCARALLGKLLSVWDWYWGDSTPVRMLPRDTQTHTRAHRKARSHKHTQEQQLSLIINSCSNSCENSMWQWTLGTGREGTRGGVRGKW